MPFGLPDFLSTLKIKISSEVLLSSFFLFKLGSLEFTFCYESTRDAFLIILNTLYLILFAVPSSTLKRVRFRFQFHLQTWVGRMLRKRAIRLTLPEDQLGSLLNSLPRRTFYRGVSLVFLFGFLTAGVSAFRLSMNLLCLLDFLLIYKYLYNSKLILLVFECSYNKRLPLSTFDQPPKA